MEFDYKNVDWKEVKKKWDEDTRLFYLKIMYKENEISFLSGLDTSKRYGIMVYINGYYKGLYSTDGHEYGKFLHEKTIRPSKKIIDLERHFDKKCKKMTDKQIIEYKKLKYSKFRTPIYSNVAQIKKMVTALE